jgi:hypothetical protein
MAEVAVINVAATIVAAALNIGSVFTGRHDDSHHREILETRRVMEDFTHRNPQSAGGVTPEKKNKFLETITKCVCMSPFITLFLVSEAFLNSAFNLSFRQRINILILVTSSKWEPARSAGERL